jgi:dTDP-4-dehydrorhamnose 3,5-epimerase
MAVVMKIWHPEILPELTVIEPDVFKDDRGCFLETFQAQRYIENGIPAHFVQDNVSYSEKGVVRGLHYQLGRPQGKLVWVAQGEIYDVAVDIRNGSPGFGRWAGVVLSSLKHRQIYIPEGFAHGFCVKSETAIVVYKCTDYYAPKEERGIRWDDRSLNIDWPTNRPKISEKDSAYPSLESVSSGDLPAFPNQESV